jgi:hypothetical protein
MDQGAIVIITVDTSIGEGERGHAMDSGAMRPHTATPKEEASPHAPHQKKSLDPVTT